VFYNVIRDVKASRCILLHLIIERINIFAGGRGLREDSSRSPLSPVSFFNPQSDSRVRVYGSDDRLQFRQNVKGQRQLSRLEFRAAKAQHDAHEAEQTLAHWTHAHTHMRTRTREHVAISGSPSVSGERPGFQGDVPRSRGGSPILARCQAKNHPAGSWKGERRRIRRVATPFRGSFNLRIHG